MLPRGLNNPLGLVLRMEKWYWTQRECSTQGILYPCLWFEYGEGIYEKGVGFELLLLLFVTGKIEKWKSATVTVFRYRYSLYCYCFPIFKVISTVKNVFLLFLIDDDLIICLLSFVSQDISQITCSQASNTIVMGIDLSVTHFLTPFISIYWLTRATPNCTHTDHSIHSFSNAPTPQPLTHSHYLLAFCLLT